MGIDSLLNLALLFISMILVGLGIRPFFFLYPLKKWEPIRMSVISYSIGKVWRNNSEYGGSYFYIPEINYSYFDEEGSRYQNSLIAWDLACIDSQEKENAEKLLEQLLSEEVAYINKNRPCKSILILEMPWARKSHYLALILGGLLILIVAMALEYLT